MNGMCIYLNKVILIFIQYKALPVVGTVSCVTSEAAWILSLKDNLWLDTHP